MSFDFETGNVSGSGQDDQELRELGEAIEECWDIAHKFGLDPLSDPLRDCPG